MSEISLIYMSAATREMTDDDLKDILATASTKNAALGITGMLLYQNRYFMQALEGEQQVVEDLYAKIAADERHHHILLIHKEPIAARSFGSWKMGYRNLEAIDVDDYPGYSNFLDEPLSSQIYREDPNRAKQLLGLFADNYAY